LSKKRTAHFADILQILTQQKDELDKQLRKRRSSVGFAEKRMGLDRLR